LLDSLFLKLYHAIELLDFRNY